MIWIFTAITVALLLIVFGELLRGKFAESGKWFGMTLVICIFLWGFLGGICPVGEKKLLGAADAVVFHDPEGNYAIIVYPNKYTETKTEAKDVNKLKGVNSVKISHYQHYNLYGKEVYQSYENPVF